MDLNKKRYSINDLKDLMARLRDKDAGCPWDLEQDFQSIKPYTIEEAYEVADAIENGNMTDLKDELGDLLFQVIFHAQMASEQNEFNFDDVIDHVTKKMIFRHPHVFGGDNANDAHDVKDRVWEQQKAKERAAKSVMNNYYLDTVTRALPSLLLANKIQKQVHKVGFEFPSIDDVYGKLNEEILELKEACANNDQAAIHDEMGDVLFCAALIAQTLGINSEESLRQANLKFIERFNGVEDILKADGRTLTEANLDEMMAAWQLIKRNSQKP